MPTYLETLTWSYLPKQAHNGLIQEIKTRANENEKVVILFPVTLARLNAAADRESATMIKIIGSLLSSQISEADTAMDSALSHFRGGIQFYRHCEVAEKKEAAELLWRYIKDSNVDYTGPIGSQLGVIPEFIAVCETTLMSQVRILGLEPELADLKAKTQRLQELIHERDLNNAATPSKENAEARRQSDEAWRDFRLAFNGYVVEHGDEGMADFAGGLNERFRYYKAQYLHQGSGSEDGGTSSEGGSSSEGEGGGSSEGGSSTEEGGNTSEGEGSSSEGGSTSEGEGGASSGSGSNQDWDV